MLIEWTKDQDTAGLLTGAVLWEKGSKAFWEEFHGEKGDGERAGWISYTQTDKDRHAVIDAVHNKHNWEESRQAFSV